MDIQYKDLGIKRGPAIGFYPGATWMVGSEDKHANNQMPPLCVFFVNVYMDHGIRSWNLCKLVNTNIK